MTKKKIADYCYDVMKEHNEDHIYSGMLELCDDVLIKSGLKDKYEKIQKEKGFHPASHRIAGQNALWAALRRDDRFISSKILCVGFSGVERHRSIFRLKESLYDQ